MKQYYDHKNKTVTTEDGLILHLETMYLEDNSEYYAYAKDNDGNGYIVTWEMDADVDEHVTDEHGECCICGPVCKYEYESPCNWDEFAVSPR